MNLPEIVTTPNGPMAVGSSPHLLKELLAEFDQQATRSGCPLDDFTLPGVSPDTVTSSLATIGLAAPDEIVIWFGWRNGGTGFAHAYPRFVPASLDRAIAQYQLHQELASGLAAADPDNRDIYEGGAGPGWLPLYEDAHGCAALCTENSDAPVPIHYANTGFAERAARAAGLFEAVSLCTIVTWWIDGIVSEAVWWDSEARRWDYDPSRLPPTQRAAHF